MCRRESRSCSCRLGALRCCLSERGPAAGADRSAVSSISCTRSRDSLVSDDSDDRFC